MRTPLVLFLLLCLAGVVQAETTLTVSRKVVMPDGTPAANAKVTLRTFTANGLVQELVTQTGADGTIEATMKYEPAADPFAGNTSAGYMMVDVAGCALAFGRLTPKAGTPTGTGMRPGRHGSGGGGVGGGGGLPLPGGGSSSTGGDTTLKLLAAYQQTGTVVDGETKAPVPGAKVMVTGFNGGVGVNLGWAGFHTPELMTTADDKGAFILRGTTAESLGGMGLPMMSSWPVSTVIAMGTVNGHTEAGGNEHFCFNNPRRTDQQVLLGSTMALEGTVKDGDGHPVAGVSVRLRGIPSYWVYSMPAAVTDANGVYEFPLLATTYRIYVLASKPGYAGSFVQAADIVPRHGEPTVVPDKITAPPLTVRPMGPAITVRERAQKLDAGGDPYEATFTQIDARACTGCTMCVAACNHGAIVPITGAKAAGSCC